MKETLIIYLYYLKQFEARGIQEKEYPFTNGTGEHWRVHEYEMNSLTRTSLSGEIYRIEEQLKTI